MRMLTVVLLALMYFASCSDESHLVGPDNEMMGESEEGFSEGVDIHQSGASVAPGDGPLLQASGGSLCICCNTCYKKYKNEYDFLRESISSCDAHRTVVTRTVDKICTRPVLVGYEEGDGGYEGDSAERIPVYENQEYVCGQEEYTEFLPWDEEASGVRERYDQCKEEAELEFDIEHEKALYDYDKCLKRCKEEGGGGGIGVEY